MSLQVGAVLWGIVGGLIAWRLRIPGGAIVGSMIGAGIFSVMQSRPVLLPGSLSLAAQIAVGILVGTSANRDLLTSGGVTLSWAVVGAVAYLLVGLALSYAAARMGHLGLDTAILGFSPGGFSGMAIIAEEEGANGAQVVVIHFVRVFLLFLLLPWVVRILVRN